MHEDMGHLEKEIYIQCLESYKVSVHGHFGHANLYQLLPRAHSSPKAAATYYLGSHTCDLAGTDADFHQELQSGVVVEDRGFQNKCLDGIDLHSRKLVQLGERVHLYLQVDTAQDTQHQMNNWGFLDLGL